jgi:iron-sulfur cluster repair protein YtfE (RIC family)
MYQTTIPQTRITEDKYAYVEHMREEHRRLEHLIQRALATIPGWEEGDAPQWMPRTAEGLMAIRNELVHHFHNEEQGGCLEEAVARKPQLSCEVQRIESQHEELLERLDELIGRCESACRASSAQAQATELEFRQLVRELREHEVLEVRVMQQGFEVVVDELPPAADEKSLAPLV